jgi:hypothetical protein
MLYQKFHADRKEFNEDMAKVQSVLNNYQSQSSKIYNLVRDIQDIPTDQFPLIKGAAPVVDTQQWLKEYFDLTLSQKKEVFENASGSQKQLIQRVDALHDEYLEQFKDNQVLLLFDEKYGGEIVDDIIDEYENTATGTNLGSENYAGIWKQTRTYINAYNVKYARAMKTASEDPQDPQDAILKTKEEILRVTSTTISTSKPEWMSRDRLSKQEAENRALTIWVGAIMAPELAKHLKIKRAPYDPTHGTVSKTKILELLREVPKIEPEQYLELLFEDPDQNQLVLKPNAEQFVPMLGLPEATQNKILDLIKKSQERQKQLLQSRRIMPTATGWYRVGAKIGGSI